MKFSGKFFGIFINIALFVALVAFIGSPEFNQAIEAEKPYQSNSELNSNDECLSNKKVGKYEENSCCQGHYAEDFAVADYDFICLSFADYPVSEVYSWY